MDFAQKGFLWALFAALLPLIIHLLNRLRYKTVPWAAMMFLRTANRQSTRRARIRQMLLLASRMLIIFFFVWAMVRPITGGWLATAAGNSTETIIILLDRSASMENRSAERQTSVREHALELLATAAKENQFGSRFILIDSATREPISIADPGQMAGLAATAATDTAANIPQMFRAAADYITQNKPGSVEIWVLSDLQKSNWVDDSADWPDIEARLKDLTLKPTIRILDLSGSSSGNNSLNVLAARLDTTTPPKAELRLEIHADEKPVAPLPMVITRNGARSQQNLTLNSTLQRTLLTLPVEHTALQWGKVELPADNNIRDNVSFFLCQPEQPISALIVSSDPQAARPMQFAVTPNPTDKNVTSQLIPPDQFPEDLQNVSLILWQAPAPKDKAVEKQLHDFVSSGGVLLLFPPESTESSGPLGAAWDKLAVAKQDTPWTVTTWDDIDGPLARGRSGQSLQLNRLPILQRRTPRLPESTTSPTRIFAGFEDGSPLLVGNAIGQGRLYACATLPKDTWSALGKGIVLLPMAQRMAREGSIRVTPPLITQVGYWKPPIGPGQWVPADKESSDWKTDAGVYRNGNQLVALNRPPIEDESTFLSPDEITPLLPDMKVDVMRGALGKASNSVTSEIWPLMILATMAFLVIEMILTLAKPNDKKAPTFVKT